MDNFIVSVDLLLTLPQLEPITISPNSGVFLDLFNFVKLTNLKMLEISLIDDNDPFSSFEFALPHLINLRDLVYGILPRLIAIAFYRASLI